MSKQQPVTFENPYADHLIADLAEANNVKQYLAEVYAQGGRRIRNLPSNGKFFKGVMVVGFTITDNALTVSDLTSQANLIDPRLIALYGDSADQQACYFWERMAIVIQEGTETSAILRQLRATLQMLHQPLRGNGATRTIPCHSHVRAHAAAVASGATTELTAIGLAAVRKSDLPLIEEGPLFVDVAKDTWTMGPETAVNSGADVPGLAFGDGWAFTRFDDAGAVYMGCTGTNDANQLAEDALQLVVQGTIGGQDGTPNTIPLSRRG